MSAGWKNWRPGSAGHFVSFAEQQSCFLDLSRVKEGYLLKKAPGTELHVGDEIVVQIQREAQKTKLPSATAELSLSGSALALYYGKPEISCSGRLLPEQKKRLKELGSRMFPELSGGSLPFGVIFRTASADASEEEIRQDISSCPKNSRGLSSMERCGACTPACIGRQMPCRSSSNGMHRQFQNL